MGMNWVLAIQIILALRPNREVLKFQKKKKPTVLYWSTSEGHKPPGTSLFQAFCWSDRHHVYVATLG